MKLIIDADSLVYESCYDVITADEALRKFQSKIKRIGDTFWTDDIELFLKGPENFRKVDFPLYKANRKSEAESVVPELFSLLEEEEIGTQAEGCEADDLVRTRAHELDEPFTVVSIDKDLRCDPFRYYSPRNEVEQELTQKEADFNYYSQLLTGDSTDNIKGLNRVGPVTAAKLLAEPKEFRDIVIREYKEHFSTDYEDVLTFVGHLIHIKRNDNDWFDIGFGDFYDRKVDIEKVGKLLRYDI